MSVFFSYAVFDKYVKLIYHSALNSYNKGANYIQGVPNRLQSDSKNVKF